MQTPPAQKTGEEIQLLSSITAAEERATTTKEAKVIYLVSATSALAISAKTARVVAFKQKPPGSSAPFLWICNLVKRLMQKASIPGR